jgi:hypothetical protein
MFLIRFVTERIRLKWFRKGRLSCPYYERSHKRFNEAAGFCRLQNCEIYFEWKVGCIPYHICEGINNNSKSTCGVYIHFSKDSMEK